MSVRFIFKFRDDFDLINSSLVARLQVSGEFHAQVKNYLYPPQGDYRTTMIPRSIIERFAGLLDKVYSDLAIKPLPLYRNFSPENFSQIREYVSSMSADKRFRQKGKPPYHLPVFYYYLEYVIPEKDSAHFQKNCLDEFEAFLPLRPGMNKFVPPFGNEDEVPPYLPGEPPYLLEYAYLKNEEEATEPKPRILDVDDTERNQNYFKDMRIGDELLTDYPANDLWVSVVEVDGWNIKHPRFRAVRENIHLLTGYENQMEDRNAYIEVLQSEKNGVHGTKALGILLSQRDSTISAPDQDCIGLLPPGTQVGLSSRNWKLEEGVDNTESAILRVIVHYCSLFLKSASEGKTPNMVISFLLEFACQDSQKMPIIIQPAISDLLALADHLKYIVVMAAGNTEKPSELTSLESGRSIKSVLKGFGIKWWQRGRAVRNFYRLAPNYLITGASYKEADESFRVYRFSNWGKTLIQLFAQGSGVLTTSSTTGYYDSMADTSAASAIMAGAAALLQNYARHKGRPLLPEELKDALLHNGSPVSCEPLNSALLPDVGYVPNVEAAMEYVDNLLHGSSL